MDIRAAARAALAARTQEPSERDWTQRGESLSANFHLIDPFFHALYDRKYYNEIAATIRFWSFTQPNLIISQICRVFLFCLYFR